MSRSMKKESYHRGNLTRALRLRELVLLILICSIGRERRLTVAGYYNRSPTINPILLINLNIYTF